MHIVDRMGLAVIRDHGFIGHILVVGNGDGLLMLLVKVVGNQIELDTAALIVGGINRGGCLRYVGLAFDEKVFQFILDVEVLVSQRTLTVAGVVPGDEGNRCVAPGVLFFDIGLLKGLGLSFGDWDLGSLF